MDGYLGRSDTVSQQGSLSSNGVQEFIKTVTLYSSLGVWAFESKGWNGVEGLSGL